MSNASKVLIVISDTHKEKFLWRSESLPDQQASKKLGLHILVAEDNRMNQIVARKVLDKLGCTYVIANDGVECLDYLPKHPFDIILMDCMMPNMDGLEATRNIRASGAAYANIPIIAFTASAMASDHKAYLDAGMDGYLDKPVDLKRITDVLSEWADRLKS